MLVSLTVHLFPLENTILPPTMGHYIHAAFLNILGQADAELPERLHADEPCKPFTVSPLQGRFDKQGKGKILIRSGTECWMRFTILDDELIAIFSRFFLESESSMLRLGGSAFQVTKVTLNENGANGGWSSCTSFEEILDCASPFDRLNIRFYSPTAFRVHDRTTKEAHNYVFPDQFHCFQSWLRKWNALSQTPFDENGILDFVQRHIRFSRYSIKTKVMNFGRYKQLGFIGDCEYQFLDTGSGEANRESQELLKQADALANFAFYCGTGYKTTMGMGQTRRQALRE